MKDKAKKDKSSEKKGKVERYEFTNEEKSRRPTNKLTLYSNCIYKKQRNMGNNRKERKATCKKPRMVASINKPLLIYSNILMFSDQNLDDVHSPHDDALVIKFRFWM